jgi:hypothetical protein
MSLIIYFPFAMPWGCVWWHKTYCQKQWLDSDETVMQQWLNSDAFDLSFLMTSSSFWDVIDHILLFCNALGVCLVTQDLLTKTIIKTVMRQSWNSDATVMEQRWLWFELLRCHWSYFILMQCLGSLFGDTIPFVKNSDQTVMRQVMEQWCNSDWTVMPLIWAF